MVRSALLRRSTAEGAAASARGRSVEAPGGRLFYETAGTGPQTIVLLHDGLVDASGYDEMWDLLAPEFRLVRYDRRGFAASPAATSPYSQTEDLAKVIAASGLERFSLVGCSAGAAIALDYALDHPGAVERLVLIGGVNGFPVSAEAKRREARNFAPALLLNLDAVIENWAKDPYLIAPGAQTARERAVANWRSNPQNIAHHALRADPEMARPSPWPRLPQLAAPTLSLVGELDIPDALRSSAAGVALIPTARRVVLKGCGHLLPLERPRETAELIADFVRSGR
jgi:pimeloyl-ACP methyl ester carboxylesterase